MKNMKIKSDGKTMTITIDLTQEIGLSKSGKTMMIATSGGNVREGEVFVGLNVYKYADK
jgi:hypothetical protein